PTVPAPQLMVGSSSKTAPLNPADDDPVGTAFGDRIVAADAFLILTGQPLPQRPPSEGVPPEGLMIHRVDLGKPALSFFLLEEYSSRTPEHLLGCGQADSCGGQDGRLIGLALQDAPPVFGRGKRLHLGKKNSVLLALGGRESVCRWNWDRLAAFSREGLQP